MTACGCGPPKGRGARRLLGLGIAVGLAGCVGPGRAPLPPALEVVLEAPVTIPAGRAHAKFQDGRQVGGVDRYAPWCELEIQTVAQAPQPIGPARLPVTGVREAFIRDYNTRAPVLLGGLSCSDQVFQETIWRLEPAPGAPVTWLRCLAPYTQCRFGPPLSPGQIQAVVGPTLRIASPLQP